MTTDPSELLNAYLDDELSDDERSVVDAALADSASLRTELAELTQLTRLLGGLPEVSPRSGFEPTAAADADHVDIVGQGDVDDEGDAEDEAVERDEVAPLISLDAERRSRVRRLGTAVAAVAAVWLLVLSIGFQVGKLPVVPDVDQFAAQHASAEAPMDGFEPMDPDDMLDPMILPDIGGDMERQAVLRRGEVTQVRYSDGVHALSVFHQPGDVDWDGMPDMGSVSMVDDTMVWQGELGGSDVLVAQRGDVVVTIVADDDMGAEMAMATAKMMPEVEVEQSFWGRVGDAPGNLLDRAAG